MAELTPGQLDVAATFFALPESNGFVLVGGAALIALQLVDRPTEDLDFFTSDPERIGDVASAFDRAAERAGWQVLVERSTPTFRRLEVLVDSEAVRVDIALDSPQLMPGVDSPSGPTLAPLELAARKLLALFDRAQPRDFVDVHSLAQLFDRAVIRDMAGQIDSGLEDSYLGNSFDMLGRIPADLLPCDSDLVPAIRSFFSEWRKELGA